jgi:catechol-2,3-dioxygenase
VEWHKGLVTPIGVDHVLLHVADLDRAARFYRILYGKEAMREASPARVWFRIGDTRLGLEQAPAGQKPRIDHFAVKVAAFDRRMVSDALTKLGARLAPSPGESASLRFLDIDGNAVEIIATPAGGSRD